MKRHMTYAAIAAGLLSLAALDDLAAQPNEAPDQKNGQAQVEPPLKPEQQARSSPPTEADAEPQGLSLEEAISRILRGQGIDVRINEENDRKAPQPSDQPALT